MLDYCIDCDRINGKFVGSAAGDKLTLLASADAQKPEKTFNEAHVPPESRCDVAVLRDELGVLWVEDSARQTMPRRKNTEKCAYNTEEKQ